MWKDCYCYEDDEYSVSISLLYLSVEGQEATQAWKELNFPFLICEEHFFQFICCLNFTINRILYLTDKGNRLLNGKV